MTDVELDERVTALEENGGGGSTQNGTKRSHSAFHFLAENARKNNIVAVHIRHMIYNFGQ